MIWLLLTFSHHLLPISLSLSTFQPYRATSFSPFAKPSCLWTFAHAVPHHLLWLPSDGSPGLYLGITSSGEPSLIPPKLNFVPQQLCVSPAPPAYPYHSTNCFFCNCLSGELLEGRDYVFSLTVSPVVSTVYGPYGSFFFFFLV